MIHSKMRFHEIRETDPVIEKIAILTGLQQFRGKFGLKQNPPELILRVRVIRAGFRGRRPHCGSTKDDLKGFAEEIVENIRHFTASPIRFARSIRRRRRPACGRRERGSAPAVPASSWSGA